MCQNPAEVGVIHRAQNRVEKQQGPTEQTDFDKLSNLLEDKEEKKRLEKEKEAEPKVDIGTTKKTPA